jgi:hypothetical protein
MRRSPFLGLILALLLSVEAPFVAFNARGDVGMFFLTCKAA